MALFDSLDRAGQLSRAAPFLAATVFAGAALGYVVCVVSGQLPGTAAAWLSFGVAALLVGGAAALICDRVLFAPVRARSAEIEALRAKAAASDRLLRDLAGRTDQQRRLRHDLRGAMSPVLLVADRLITHADPAVARSGTIMVRTVERAMELLAEPNPDPSPPGDP